MERAKEIIDRANAYENGTRITLGADSITKASLVEDIMKAKQEVGGMDQAMITLMEVTAIHDELAAFMNKYDSEIISILLKLFDTPKYYKETRATLKEPRELHNVYFNWLFGTTPDFWSRIMVHEQETGMKSRIILCSENVELYNRDVMRLETMDVSTSGQGKITNKGVIDQGQQDKLDLLARELAHISTHMRGYIQVTPEAGKILNDWWRAGAKPLPPQLEIGDYKARRDLYVIKFAGLKAASEGVFFIDVPQMQWAMATLFDNEDSTKYIGADLRQSAHGRIMDEAYQFFASRTIKPDGTITAFSGQDLRKFLSTKLQVNEIENMVNQMVQSGYIIVRSDASAPRADGLKVKVQRFVVNPKLRSSQPA